MQQVINAVVAGLARDSKDSRRLFHGRGHTYPGLEYINVDYHCPLILITLYKAPDDVLFSDFLSQLIVLASELCIVVQRRYIHKSPSEVVHGMLPDVCYAKSGEMRFQLNIGNNQNSGYFLDMKESHDWLADQVAGCNVLNLFSYTCAFSVAALKGGARSVVNVDMSAGVLKTGAANHQLNDLDPRASRFMKLDVLKSWGRIRRAGPFDFIVIDPPSNQRGSFKAEADYAKVLKRIPELLKKKGRVLACLNAPHLPVQFVLDLMAEHCPQCQFVESLAPSKDFPEQNPDRALKALSFSYESQA